MKTNLLLLFGTSLLCLLLTAAVLQYVKPSFERPEGSSFESLEHLRAEIEKRDMRDLRPDKSVSFRSIVQPHPSDFIIYELQPSLNVRFQNAALRTNSHGMRSPEVSIEKPKDTLRIALLGDSFAFGWGVEQEESFAAVLQQELEEKLTGPKVQVLNFGVPGYSTFQEVTQFLEKGQQFQPDLVLVFFVDNDFGLPFFVRNLDSSEGLDTARGFQAKRQRLKGEERRELSRYLDQTNPNRQLKKLAEVMAGRGVPVYLTINPRGGMHIDERNLYVLRSTENLHYIPFRDRFYEIIKAEGLTRAQLSLANDPHPNARRHAIYGKLLAEMLFEPLRALHHSGYDQR